MLIGWLHVGRNTSLRLASMQSQDVSGHGLVGFPVPLARR
jgi:hypothetical protein